MCIYLAHTETISDEATPSYKKTSNARRRGYSSIRSLIAVTENKFSWSAGKWVTHNLVVFVFVFVCCLFANKSPLAEPSSVTVTTELQYIHTYIYIWH